MGRDVKGIGCKGLPFFQGAFPISLFEYFQQFSVVFHGGHAEDILVILCCSPDQGDPPYINFFYDFLLSGSLGYRFFKRVQIYNYNIELGNLIFP